MKYPELENTPIREIIFSISYEEIVNDDCFDRFIELDFIKKKFNEINPSVTSAIEIINDVPKFSKNKNGFHLKNNSEVLQMRKGSFSYHYLNKYCKFSEMLEGLMSYWKEFNEVTKEKLTINSISVRYINVINIDDENPESRLVQLYPKQSSDRDIINFQNSIHFTYRNSPNYLVNVVSTKPKHDMLLLDITVSYKIDKESLNKIDLKENFKPLQEIKNKVFFDSITAKALIRYINQNN